MRSGFARIGLPLDRGPLTEWRWSMGKVMAFIAAAAMILAAGLMVSAQDVENGKKVYAAQKCQLCHSVSGVGNKKSPLDGVGAKLKEDEIRKWIKTPKEMKADTKMKAYPAISDKDLADLTAYMLVLK
jgi:cytochrome c2